MERLRAYRKFLMLPALVWLLTQLAMTGILGIGPTAAATGPVGGAADGSYTLVICTPTGWETVTVNADGTTTSAPETVSAYQACEYCQTPDGAAVLPSFSPDAPALRAGSGAVWLHAFSTAAPDAHRPAGFLSRAPPV